MMAPVPKARKADVGPVPNILAGTEMDKQPSTNELWFH